MINIHAPGAITCVEQPQALRDGTVDEFPGDSVSFIELAAVVDGNVPGRIIGRTLHNPAAIGFFDSPRRQLLCQRERTSSRPAESRLRRATF